LIDRAGIALEILDKLLILPALLSAGKPISLIELHASAILPTRSV
jgi:hypothetical protein